MPLLGTTACAGSGPDKYGAESTCETFVKRQLKAPSTADFNDEQASGGPNKFTVTGTVDAENSFGAKLRTAWICTTHSSDGDTWYPDRVQLLGQ